MPCQPVCSTKPLERVEHQAGHIVNTQQKLNRKCSRDFFAAVGCIKTIAQIIMLHAAGTGNYIITAMMIGKQQSLGANYLTGAATTKDHDGVFERGFVDGI
ncbi:hypothetical protein D9M69_702480 [compost metagenome]